MARKKIKNAATTDLNYYQNLLQNSNIQAYLLTIRKGEGTIGSKGYSTLVGGGKFSDFNHHPNVYKPKYKSTAAGAYQFLHSTWQNDSRALKLPDFTPNSQDIAALYEINKAGALNDVLNGNIESAINKTNRIWVSLPGAKHDAINKYSQGLVNALNFYKINGGVLHSAGQTAQLNIVNLGNYAPENIGIHSIPISVADKTQVVSPIYKRILSPNDDIQNFRNVAGTDFLHINLLSSPLQYRKEGADDVVYDKRTQHKNNSKSIINVNKELQNLQKATEYIPQKKISPAQIMRNIFFNYPGIKSKWNNPANSDLYPAQISDAGSLRSEQSMVSPDSGMLFNANELSIADICSKYAAPGNWDSGLEDFEDNKLSISPDSLASIDDDTKSKTQADDIAAAGSNSGRMVNINLNKSMIGNFTINTSNVKEGLSDFKNKVEEMLLEILNSANAIH